MQIGDYSLERRLGAGAMGEVWLTTQLSLRRKVALKILLPSVTKDPDFVNRFLYEMRLVAKLCHPNIVTAYDSGFDKGFYYLAEEYVDGGALSAFLRIDKVIPERKALLIVKKLAEALQYAWTKFKILHRDIKPANIMLDANGEPKLMDLGISKSLCEESSMTLTGVIMGTPDYMSPEQGMADKSIDFRSDIYSLGATLYYISTGSLPYEGPTPIAVISKHMTNPLPSPRSRNPNLSVGCDALIKTMMAKEREGRQASWDDVVRDIDLVLEGKLPATSAPDQRGSLFSKTLAWQVKDWNWTHISVAYAVPAIALLAVVIFFSHERSILKASDKSSQAPAPVMTAPAHPVATVAPPAIKPAPASTAPLVVAQPPMPTPTPTESPVAVPVPAPLPIATQAPAEPSVAIPAPVAMETPSTAAPPFAIPAPVAPRVIPAPRHVQIQPPASATPGDDKDLAAEALRLYALCQDAAGLVKYKTECEAAVSRWASMDPPAAGKWLVKLPESRIRSESILSVVSAWTSIDPEAAAKWAESFPDGSAPNFIPTREYAINRVAEIWGRNDPAAATKWAEHSSDPGFRKAALPLVAKGWAAKDPLAAVKWVNSLPKDEGRDQAVLWGADVWAYRDPQAAADWAASLLKGDTLNKAIAYVARTWARKDPEAAASWIRQASLPASVKASALRSIGK